jgi:hypothetical protein
MVLGEMAEWLNAPVLKIRIFEYKDEYYGRV